jgi:hypothetical protein
MLVVCVHSPVQLQPPSSKASQPVFGRQCTVLSRARSLQLQRSVHKVGSMHDWSESAVQRPAGLRHPLLCALQPLHTGSAWPWVVPLCGTLQCRRSGSATTCNVRHSGDAMNTTTAHERQAAHRAENACCLLPAG